MTWSKSLIMRRNSPLLQIDSSDFICKSSYKQSHKDTSSGSSCSRNNKKDWIDKTRSPLTGNMDGQMKWRYTAKVAARQAEVRSSKRRSNWIQFEDEEEKEAEPDRISSISSIGMNAKSAPQSEKTTQPHRLPHLVQKSCQEHQIGVVQIGATTTTTHSGTPVGDQSQRINAHKIANSSNCASLTSQQQQQTSSLLSSSSKQQQQSIINNNNKFETAHQGQFCARRGARTRTTANAMAIGLPDRAQLLLITGIGLLLIILITSSTAINLANASGVNQQYFEVQPEAQYLVQNGHDVRIRCLIRSRQGECLWLKNGRAIGFIAKKYQFTRQPEDGDCSLMIRNVSVQQDDGLWQCQVTASDVEQDTLQSREVHLVVLVAPERPQIKNTSQNTQRIILEENKTKFVVCEMRGGNPAPQIEWILDNKSISKEAQTNSSIAQSANTSQRVTYSRLKMSDIKRSMNGKNLTCVGVHQTMNQSTSVELDVQYVPSVSVSQREYSIVEGSPLSISCQVDSNPPPNIVNWRLVSDGASASISNGKGGPITLPTRPGPVLEFERISRELNQNTFECLAQNSYGISMPADVKLNVLYAPVVLNTSNSDSVALGSEAHLACIFDGNPEPEVKWHYTDPLSRSSKAVELENNKQQFLNIKNVTYRNEGDYHCEAKNQINGVHYGVRSSNIILDVFGEPQFLVKSPVHAKAVQGTKSDLTVAFCSDPSPNKVYWQFGSLRIDVRLNNINNGHQQVTAPIQQMAPSGTSGAKQSHPMSSRFQAHPLQSIYKRESSFSKVPSCFEAQLSILDPELIDQRDYILIVQNERGHQSATVRLRVTSPLSPMIMITSAFVTICGLFLMSLVVMFLIRKSRHGGSSNGSPGGANGNQTGVAALNNGRGEKGAVEHLVNNGLANTAAVVNQQLIMQQTRGIVNGAGNGLANGASNPAQTGQQLAMQSANGLTSQQQDEMAKLHLMSMASSDTSGDQKQLLFSSNSDSRNSSSSGRSTTSTTNQCGVDFNVNCSTQNSSANQSSANSTPVPHLNHVSVEQVDELHLSDAISASSATYKAAECITRDAQLSGSSPASHHLNANGGSLIYANLDYPQQQQTDLNAHSNHQQANTMLQLHNNNFNQMHTANNNNNNKPVHRRQQTPMEHSPTSSNLSAQSSILQVSQSQSQIEQQQQQPNQQQQRSPTSGLRSNVGATIAMMNSLAAANQNQTSSPNSGVLNGAINQQLANSRQIRKPGPPKPPKPSIQQRSRFYQQQQQHGGLVMIGSPAPVAGYQGSMSTSDQDDGPSANELAVEYSRIAFPARAEL